MMILTFLDLRKLLLTSWRGKNAIMFRHVFIMLTFGCQPPSTARRTTYTDQCIYLFDIKVDLCTSEYA